MKKILFFLSLAIAISCSNDSDTPPADPCTNLNTIAPFETFQINLKFSLPSNAPTNFKDLTFGQAAAWYKTVPQTAPSQYWYTFYTSAGAVWDGSDGIIPPGALLGVGTSGNTIIVNFAGAMTRAGTAIPTGYSKDNSCDKWDTKAAFSYVLKFDPISKTLVSAIVTITGTGFASTYDCTSAMTAAFNTPATASDNTYEFTLNNKAITNATGTQVMNFVALNVLIYRVG